MGPGYWRALWVSVHEGDDEIHGATYYRKLWVLGRGRVKKLTKALLLASNMGSTLMVNGAVVGKGDSWRHAKTFDLLPFLVEGSNVIGVMPVNTRASSRVLVGASMEFGDGSEESFWSDQTWRASRVFQPGWDTAAFDENKFDPVFVYGRPPIGPCGDLPYPSLAKARRVGVDGLVFPRQLTAGERGSFLWARAPWDLDLAGMALSFSRGGVEIFSVPVAWPTGDAAPPSGSFQIPFFALGTKYDVSFQHQRFDFDSSPSTRLVEAVGERSVETATHPLRAVLNGNGYTLVTLPSHVY